MVFACLKTSGYFECRAKFLIHSEFNMGRHSDSVENRASTTSQVSSCSRRCYGTNSELMVINCAKATNNSATGKTFGVTECNVHTWRQMKDKLRNVKSSRKAFRYFS